MAMDARGGEPELWERAQRGNRDAFALAVERYRRELEIHCYRMLGSHEDAEDLVQETFLRAWRRRETFRRESTLRAWLYGIATNACLDALRHRSRRVMPPSVAPPADYFDLRPVTGEVTWLEPYPDRLLDEVVDAAERPDEAIVARETIELAFMAAIQHLPPRQRAVLILRDVLAWSARETAALLDTSVVASNSALQRARDTLKEHLPERRLDWQRGAAPDPLEQNVLARYMDAWKRTDLDALVDLLKEDAQLTMPPWPAWYEGRDSIARFLAANPFAPSASTYVHVPTRANRQPAFAVFRQAEPGGAFSPRGIDVLRVADGQIEAIDFFMQPQVIERFAVELPG